ncbi:MAG: hypothetical protein WCA77_05220 [Thermoplasmata archaeon]
MVEENLRREEPEDALAWLSDGRHVLGDLFRFQGGAEGSSPRSIAASEEYAGQANRIRAVLNRLALAGVRSQVGPRTVHDGYELADIVNLELGPEVGTDLTDILQGMLDLRVEGTDRIYRRGASRFEVHYSSIRESDPAHAEWCEPE